MWMLTLVSVMISPAVASILMPHSFYSNPKVYYDDLEPVRQIEVTSGVEESSPIVEQHNRNCFFTPVQCMLPTADSHKDVQTLHGVYQPSQVRRSSSPWSYQKRTENQSSRFFQWLSR